MYARPSYAAMAILHSTEHSYWQHDVMHPHLYTPLFHIQTGFCFVEVLHEAQCPCEPQSTTEPPYLCKHNNQMCQIPAEVNSSIITAKSFAVSCNECRTHRGAPRNAAIYIGGTHITSGTDLISRYGQISGILLSSCPVWRTTAVTIDAIKADSQRQSLAMSNPSWALRPDWKASATVIIRYI